MRKPGFARIALCPVDGKGPRWEFPPTFLMHHAAGLWMARIVPRLEEKVSRATWTAALHDGKIHAKSDEKDRKAGGVPPEKEENPPGINEKKMYPAGKPLRMEEREMSKQHRPKSTSSGDYLCWDYSSHAGCVLAAETCTKGKHELMSVNGLHGSILMQLARRGGHKSCRRIKPEQVDGYLQAIRDGMLKEELSNRKPNAIIESKEDKRVWKPKRAAGAFNPSGEQKWEEDVSTYAFGSGKRLPHEEALTNAQIRATQLQSELDMGTSFSDAPSSSRIDGKTRGKGVSFNKNDAVTTVNPMAGGMNRVKPCEDQSHSWHWDKEVLPLDFAMLDFSDMEEGTRKLYHMKDDWLYLDEITPVIEGVSSALTDREKEVDEWWAEYTPKVAERITPFIKNVLRREKNTSMPFKEVYLSALDHLAEGGSIQEQQLALLALEGEKRRTDGLAGNDKEVRITWGATAKTIDYTSQQASFGSLHFLAIDMGEDVPLNLRMRQALGGGEPS